MYLFLQIAVCALAVLGFYFLLKVISARLFSSGCVAAAVIIERKEQLEALDILISEASSSLVFSRGRRIAVIASRELIGTFSESERKMITEIVDELGAEIFVL